MFDIKRLAKMVKEKANELTRDKKYDLYDADSYRGEDGQMVGEKDGEWNVDDLPEHIHMTSSTAIQDVKYDPKTGDADVKFRNGNGKTYRYPGVSQEEIDAVRKAASKGRAFWSYIRPHSTEL